MALTEKGKKTLLYGGMALAIGIPAAIALWYYREKLFPPVPPPGEKWCEIEKRYIPIAEWTKVRCVPPAIVPPKTVTISGTAVWLEEMYVHGPLEGVRIVITNRETGESYYTYSDRNGKWVFENIPIGYYDFISTKEGYCDAKAYYVEASMPGDVGYTYTALRLIATLDLSCHEIAMYERDLGCSLGEKYRVNKITGKFRAGGVGFIPLAYEIFVDGNRVWHGDVMSGQWKDIDISPKIEGSRVRVHGVGLACYVDEINFTINVTELAEEVCE
ncbi:MAG: carboxypeptidase-like regulatory domain-containing protein [Bacillota bacterium]